MKRSLLAVTVVALFALLIAPAAMAKPGNGNGNGKKSDSSVQTTSNSGSCDWNCSPPPPDCDWDHSCPPPPDCDWDNSCPPPCDWKCPPPCHPNCPPPPPIDCTDAFADPNILWPPNHKFHLVTVVVPGADDVESPGSPRTSPPRRWAMGTSRRTPLWRATVRSTFALSEAAWATVASMRSRSTCSTAITTSSATGP